MVAIHCYQSNYSEFPKWLARHLGRKLPSYLLEIQPDLGYSFMQTLEKIRQWPKAGEKDSRVTIIHTGNSKKKNKRKGIYIYMHIIF